MTVELTTGFSARTVNTTYKIVSRAVVKILEALTWARALALFPIPLSTQT